MNILQELRNKRHPHVLGAFDIFKYIGPGLLVTVGFIDPGNWASNFAAGSEYGYALLWVVTLSTIMLIALQHNVAHLGIITGLCLSEAAVKYTPRWVGRPIVVSAVLASISTSLAEILGGAIALQMLFGISIPVGALLVTIAVLILLFTNSYKKIERAVIGFVSIIGLSFIYELFLVHVDWGEAARAAVVPSADTLFSMLVGWAINSAMILLAASTFYTHGEHVDDLAQANAMLAPLLGSNASNIFALALLLAGISSTITSGMAAGSIFSGLFGESYNAKDPHSAVGVVLSLGIALLIIFFIGNPFQGLIISQMVLSLQLPFTVFLQVSLTSSKRVMGKYVNKPWNTAFLYSLAGIVTVLNIWLLVSSLA